MPKSSKYKPLRNVGEWKITTAWLHHDGHLLGEDVYGTYKHVKKLSEEDETYAKEFIENLKILPRNLAFSKKPAHLQTKM